MTNPNFGLLNQGGFQNALAQGLQFGEAIRQDREEKEFRNALANFDPRNPETLKPVIAANPQVGIQLQGQVRDQQRADQQEAAQQKMMVRRLLGAAKQNPQQALAAAQSMGIDVSSVPPPGSPEFAQFVDQELFILDALEDPEKMTAVQQDIQSLGIDPSTPEGRAAVAELVLFKFGKETTDEFGRPSVALPQITLPGQQQQQTVSEGAIAANPQTGERIIFRNGQWQPLGDAGSNASGGFPGN